MPHANRTDAVAATLYALHRDLVTLPRGGKQWQVAFARYRRTDHWRDWRAAKLKKFPFCQVCGLMGDPMVKATEVHHSRYAYFCEDIITEMVSICKKCHLGYEQRRMGRYKR